MIDIRRLPNETETQYIWRICSAKDIGTLEITWEEVAEILNKELRDEGEYYTSSAYRKKYQMAKLFKDEVFENETSNALTKQFADQKRELEQLKIQYRDERNAWNKQNYTAARINQKMDYLAESLSDIGRKQFIVFGAPIETTDKDMIICLSDPHIGQTFNNRFGAYDSDIAKERLETYLDKIFEIGEKHNIENVYVACLGDMISSNIHLSIQVSNRENVIDQIKLSAEYIASFCTELAEKFKSVKVYGVSGNHSRLVSNKELDIKDERLDDLILWITKQMLQHIENIEVNTENLDTTIAEMSVRGKDYLLIHGDYDQMTANDISKLSMMINKFPYAILSGHRHTPAMYEINGIKCIQSASLAGSGDDYTVIKRLSGKPNQTVLVCDDSGIDCIYNVNLA